MKKRIISAVILLMIVIPIIYIGGNIYNFAVGIIGCFAFKEILDLRKGKKNEYPNMIKVIGLISLLFLIYSNFDGNGILFGCSYRILCGVILLLSSPVIFYKNAKYDIDDAFNIIGYVLFLGIGFNLLISIYNYGIKYFILLILITTLTDTFALFGGKLIGKHKFTKISPNKTIEGSIIGTCIATFVATMFYVNVINVNKNLFIVIMSIIFLSIIGQIGDLFFSAIKRKYDKKDFAKLIPGHGGILDRLDSIIFVLFAFLLVIFYI